MRAPLVPVLMGVVGLALQGCAGTGSYVTLIESPDGTTGKILVTGSKGQQIVERAGEGVPLDASAPPRLWAPERVRQDFAAARALRPMPPESFMLYFESGGTRLTEDSRAILPRIIDAVAKRPAPEISVIGHADTLGRPDFNEGLAMARARGIATLLKDKKLDVVAINVEYHGERNLLVATPDETPEARNRRVEVSIR
jgi:peptidoglycan-associated lipoprotein